MAIIKHIGNEKVLRAIMLYCPYCTKNLYYTTENLVKMLTHIRTRHIKCNFPISNEDSRLIHKELAHFETGDEVDTNYYKGGFYGNDYMPTKPEEEHNNLSEANIESQFEKLSGE